MPLPNFIVIGASRSGTTSLHHYLGQHPQIFMCPIKEPNYFSFPGQKPPFRGRATRYVRTHSVFGHEAYRRLFDGVTDERAVGEVSPMYLYADQAPEAIRKQIPDVRLVATLRHPVERAYATFMGRTRDGMEVHDTFLEAIRGEPELWRRGRSSGALTRASFYHRNLSRYFELFESGQIRVFLFEELVADPLARVREVFEFLGVDPDFEPDVSMRYNPSGRIGNPVLRALWVRAWHARRLSRHVLPESVRDALYEKITSTVVKPPLPAAEFNEVLAMYREDIEQLQGLIDRDLTHWLTPRTEG